MQDNERMTIEQFIVAATLERHSLKVTGQSWIDQYSKFVENEEEGRTPEMAAVFDSMMAELVQYLGVVPPMNFNRVLQ